MGFFNAPANTQVDTSGAYGFSKDYREQSQEFFDPNSQFYQTGMRQFGNQNTDSLLALYRQGRQGRAGQGFQSNAINQALETDLGKQSAEDTQRYGYGLYRQGLGTGTQLANIGQQYYGQGMQGDMQNAQANAQYLNSFISGFSGILGGIGGGYGKEIVSGIGAGVSGIGGFLGSLFNGGSKVNNNNPYNYIDYSNTNYG